MVRAIVSVEMREMMSWREKGRGFRTSRSAFMHETEEGGQLVGTGQRGRPTHVRDAVVEVFHNGGHLLRELKDAGHLVRLPESTSGDNRRCRAFF